MFCPECGNTEEPLINGVCKTCFLKTYKMLKIPENTTINVCKHCNSKLFKGQWIDEYIPEDEIIYRTLEEEIQLDELVEDPIIDLEILQMRGTIAECEIESTGTIQGSTITETHQTNIKIKHTVCPSCSKKESGYYEAVIQVRADKRNLKTNEIENIEQHIIKTVEKQSQHDKLAYIPQVLKPKEGIDYYIGSLKTARKIVNNLKTNIGGISKESPRLISEDSSTGKGLYRIWISFRIPEFEKGDFIKFEDKNHKIININGNHIQTQNLENQETTSIPWNKYDKTKLISKKEDIKKTTVTNKTPTHIQILDPEDYSTVDLNMKPEYQDIEIGEEINCIKINNILYIL